MVNKTLVTKLKLREIVLGQDSIPKAKQIIPVTRHLIQPGRICHLLLCAPKVNHSRLENNQGLEMAHGLMTQATVMVISTLGMEATTPQQMMKVIAAVIAS